MSLTPYGSLVSHATLAAAPLVRPIVNTLMAYGGYKRKRASTYVRRYRKRRAGPYKRYGRSRAIMYKRKSFGKSRFQGRKGRSKMVRHRRSVPLRTTVRNLARSLKSDQATHIHRYSAVVQDTVAVNRQEVATVFDLTATHVENAVSYLRYYDPTVPGTLVTADAAVGTYQRDIHIASIFDEVSVQNNFQIPVEMKFYMCYPKNDTSQTCVSAYSQSITDQVVTGGTGVSSFGLELNDCKQVTDAYNIKLAWKGILQPGRTKRFYNATKAFDYSPALFDQHNLAYQKKWGGMQYVALIRGLPSHDNTTTTFVGNTNGGYDAVLRRKFTITYDAGVNLYDISFDNNQDAVSTALISSKPVADNQAFAFT